MVRLFCALWPARIAAVTDSSPLSSPPEVETDFHALHPHPGRPAPADLAVWAGFQHLDNGDWRWTFRIDGDTARLRMPAPMPAQAADGLWQHTCFEAFVGRSGQDDYVEFNFSPSSQWARYAFCAERVRDTQAEAWVAGLGAPRIQVLQDIHRLRLIATVPAALVPQTPLQIGLTAVIESADGTVSHWALHHPRSQADFHHVAGRCLRAPAS